MPHIFTDILIPLLAVILYIWLVYYLKISPQDYYKYEVPYL